MQTMTKSWKIAMNDIKAFAAIVGDVNPVHIDP